MKFEICVFGLFLGIIFNFIKSEVELFSGDDLRVFGE